MNHDRESRRQLSQVFDELAPNSERAREVMGAYNDAIVALERCADALWLLDEIRFSAAIESRVQDLEVQARRNLQAIADRERAAITCSWCAGHVSKCGPPLWAEQKKCCPDCTHTREAWEREGQAQP